MFLVVLVSQVCSEDGMEFTLRTPEGFIGRIYTYGYYDRCFFRGNGGTVNVLRISGPQGYPECGTQRVRNLFYRCFFKKHFWKYLISSSFSSFFFEISHLQLIELKFLDILFKENKNFYLISFIFIINSTCNCSTEIQWRTSS